MRPTPAGDLSGSSVGRPDATLVKSCRMFGSDLGDIPILPGTKPQLSHVLA